MENMNELIKLMNLDFFGTKQHKFSPEELLMKEKSILLDIRTEFEVDTLEIKLKHHATEVLHIPMDQIPERLTEIPKDRPVGVFCSAGTRAAMISLYLQSHGYKNVKTLEGGYGALIPELMPGKVLKQINK